MYKGAILTSATVPWHGLIFCLERLPRNIVYKPRWSSTIEASEVALVVLTADLAPLFIFKLVTKLFYIFYLISPFIAVDDEIILIEIIVVDLMS